MESHCQLLQRLGIAVRITLSSARRFFVSIFLGGTILLIGREAYAQDNLSSVVTPSSEEDILFAEIPSVYSASKYTQKVTEAPSAVTIITSDEIAKYGHRTLADILRTVNGFFVTYDRDYSYLGVRGFNRPGDFNSRVLLLIDGHRLNDNQYDQAGLGTEGVVDVDLIERIEIIRGPSSSLYGTNALFAVINIITKRGRDIKGVELSTEIGSFDSYKGRVTYGNRFQNGLEVLFSSSFYDSRGHRRLFFKEFNTPQTNFGIARKGDDDRFPYFFAKMSYYDFSLQGGFLSREKGFPTATYGTVFNTTKNRSLDEHGYVNLKYDHEFDPSLQLSSRFYYDRFYYHGRYLYDYGTEDAPDLVANQDFALGEWWGAETQLTKQLWQRHKITLGAEYRDNFRQSMRNADIDPFALYLNFSKSARNWAIFFQDEVRLLDNLLLNAGVRYDYYNTFGGSINPRIALIYNLKQTTFKVLYGEAFRAPSVYEKFYVGTGFKENPHLKPEEITTYEVVVERDLNGSLRATASGYYYTINGLITQTPDPRDNLLVFRNVESVEAKGLEFAIDGKGPFGLEGKLGYALQDTHNRKTGKRLTNSPPHMVKFNLIIPLLRDKIFAGIEARYLSDRHTLAGNTASDYVTTNLTLYSQNLIPNLQTTLSLYNLFDQRYDDPGSGEHRQDLIEQDGRTFWLKLKYWF
ncbi:MAG: TonB-dependent receptor plug domain-containing protein [Candidatus Binatia bacterium]